MEFVVLLENFEGIEFYAISRGDLRTLFGRIAHIVYEPKKEYSNTFIQFPKCFFKYKISLSDWKIDTEIEKFHFFFNF